MKAANETFSRAEIEQWLMRRCAHEIHAPNKKLEREQVMASFIAGVTSWEIRRERIREFINRYDLGDNRIGKRADGTQETFASCFERLYGEPARKNTREF